MKKLPVVAVFLATFLGLLTPSGADEGMWTLNNLPLKQLKEKYNFIPTPEWIDHVQRSSVRLPNCSSSFVSSDGLIFTNGHCVEEAVQALSTPKNNLYEKGFYAPTYARELKTDRVVRILLSTKDVTQTVNQAEDKTQVIQKIQRNKIGLSDSTMLSQGISQDDKDSFICEVVVLYQGGQYQNYCYKVYKDIRLVFSSEKNIWFLGGDADNFEYPRYAMDVAFLRAYENGKPVKTKNYFKWSKSGAKEDEPIFVSGHPGSTKRLLTFSALKTERDVRVPFLLDLFRRRELTSQQFMLRGKEERRIAESDLFSWQNSRKLYVGKIRGLQDPKLIESKDAFEKKFFRDSYTNASASNKFADGLIMVRDAQYVIGQNYAKYMLLVRGLGFDSRLYSYAQSLVSGNKSLAKSVLYGRKDGPPLRLDYEESKLIDSLSHLFEVLGSGDPVIVGLNNGPYDFGQFLVFRTVLSDINEHQKLVEGGISAIETSDDPMIQLARFIKSQSESYKTAYNNAVEQERQGYALLSDSLFKAYGTDQYPDATFTLRLSFGKVSGYKEGEKHIFPMTTIGGAYRHSAEFDNTGDYKLPARWLLRKKFVNKKIPLNFTSNLDITGGNSGSPVFNKNSEIVGIVFDSNIEGLVSDYDYSYAPNARAVAVHSSGILEVLKKIYQADRLVTELTR